MIILGLNCGLDFQRKPVDNGGAALLINGQIVGAIAEERLTRKKHDGGACNSIQYLLKANNLEISDVDYIAVSFYQHPMKNKSSSLEIIKFELDLDSSFNGQFYIIDSHHKSHASAAFFQSPFDSSLICVWDNEGSIIGNYMPKHEQKSEVHSYFLGEKSRLIFLSRELEGFNDVGFGQAYSRFTQFLGLGNYTNAGKLMGLAAYGDSTSLSKLPPLWYKDEKGALNSTIKKTDGSLSVPILFARAGITPCVAGGTKGYLRKDLQNLAAYIQKNLENTAIQQIKELVAKHKVSSICISGGVGLNSVLNSKIQKATGLPVYVPPQPDDIGQGIGNALLAYTELTGKRSSSWCGSSSLGKVWESEKYLEPLMKKIIQLGGEYSKTNSLNQAAKDLAEDNVVGWFQGRSEYGARALGYRSILANPAKKENYTRVNTLKRRELYRPLAPSVIDSKAHMYFELFDSPLWKTMSGTVSVKPEYKNIIPAVVHKDGTARIQIVDKDTNSKFFNLIDSFGKITGIYVLINTSFNIAGSPIVESPFEALEAAIKLHLDYLYIDNLRIDLRNAI